ncbi:hypothetical protein [Planococcus dechangensis]|uniref:Uncharacterized protein n=1 Tax=Planococcus dechangensis TaxID=1176255 RepID=A0ABV9MFT1_9BACL
MNNYKRFTSSSIPYFLAGILCLIAGFNGEALATAFSKPPSETSWFVSGNLIDTFTYVPLMIGGCLLVLGLGKSLFSSNPSRP